MIGIAPKNWQTLRNAVDFVTSRRLTFTNLWDRSNAVWRHYGSPYTSRMWIIDKSGNRVGNISQIFSAAKAQRIVDTWK